MKKIEMVIRHVRLKAVKTALLDLGVHGMTVTEVKGFGRQGGHREVYRGTEILEEYTPKLKLEVVLEAEKVEAVIEAVCTAAATGNVGDGKIFVFPVESVTRIRTRENGREAL